MKKLIKYPLGQQDFKTLRNLGYLYVDKTQYIERLLQGGQFLFLARPRRFGKSLFLSTLQCFFEGQRELFKGLAVDSIDWNWDKYPVLRLDLNSNSYEEPGRLDSVLDTTFSEWETMYGIDTVGNDYSQRFRRIIKAAHEKTGRQVVILVDEYDKPLVANINKRSNIEHYRDRLSSIYSNFKSSAQHLRFVFLTGVSRFSKLSVFSDLNNLVDITFIDEYADLCGITYEEMVENLQSGISKLAETNGVSEEEVRLLLKLNYDGYRFAERGSEIYNPWSLLNAMNYSKIINYWNGSNKYHNIQNQPSSAHK